MEITFNTFDGGLDKNTSPKNIAPNKYVHANDITLFNNGDFGNVSPIKGTSILRTLISPSLYGDLPNDIFQSPNVGDIFNIIAVSECYIKHNNNKVKAHLTVLSRPLFFDTTTNSETYVNTSGYDVTFIPSVYGNENIYLVASNNEKLQIWATAEDNSFHLLVYEEDFINPIHRNKTGDIIRSGADDTEVVYINTGANTPMQVILNSSLFPFSKPNVYLVPFENMQPPTTAIVAGSCMSGSYSFMVRLYSSITKQYSKFSLPSHPVILTGETQSSHSASVSLISAPIGSNSGKGITVGMTFNENIAADFDYYQVAVIRNVDGNGLASEVVDLLPVKYKGDILSTSYSYLENSREASALAGEYLIDDAPIDHFSGIAISDNLFLGAGTTYKDLSYDRGNLSISSSSGYDVSSLSVGEDFGKPFLGLDQSKYYFRGEVYRFAAAYHDDFGNWSDPFVFDMSVCSNNEALTGKDFKFPAIFQEPIIAGNNAIRVMGLSIIGLENHPTWAKGVAILRAERIRDIQFQSPLVHSMAVMPLDAKTFPGGSYPQQGDPEVADAQVPSGVLGTLIPKNLQDIVPKHIIRGNLMCQYKYGYEPTIPSQKPQSGAAYSVESQGGRESIAQAAAHVHFVYPPNNLYNNANITYKPYAHKQGDELDFVDIQTLRIQGAYLTNDESIIDESTSFKYFNKAQYSTVGRFIASDNFCNNTKTPTNINTSGFGLQKSQILEYKDVPYGKEGTVLTSSIPSLKSNKIAFHGGMLSTQLNEGSEINQHPAGVIVTANPIIDINHKLFVSAADQSVRDELTGTTSLFAPNSTLQSFFANKNNFSTSISDSVIGLINTANNCNNPSINKFNFTGAVYTHVPIVNITRGLRDDRYGSEDASHRFYFTGTYRRLTASEVANNTPISFNNIYGGDCNYDLHTFKIAESTYYVPDANLIASEAESKRINGTSFWNTTRNYEIGRPLTNLGHVQHLSVFLESEIKAELSDKSANNRFGKASGSHTIPIPENLGDGKTPFTYQFNLDFAKDFDDKIWFKQPRYISDNRFLLNRIHYSDIRIMQSDIIGFDKFRAGNYYDIDESHGKIAKIVNSRNNLYLISERSIQIIPIFSNSIETSDGVQLSVRNNEAIGKPRVISAINGTIIDRGICQDKDGIYFIDTNQNQIMYVSGDQVISLNLELDSYLSSKIAFIKKQKPNIASLIYDYVNQELIVMTDNISNQGINMIWSKRNEKWVSDFSKSTNFQSTNGSFSHGGVIFAGLFSNNNYTISKQSDNNTFLGSTINPSISFIINKDAVVPKIFDVFDVNSDLSPEDIELATFNTYPDQADQQCSMIIANNNKREGLFRIPILRNNNQRMRGLFAKATINFHPLINNETERPSLFSVGTKFRYSSRVV